MKKNLFTIFSMLIFLTAFGFTAQAQAKPDLTVSKVEITKDRSNLFVQKITVTVTNGCREANADTSYVLLILRNEG
jgi:hypothetical protein